MKKLFVLFIACVATAFASKSDAAYPQYCYITINDGLHGTVQVSDIDCDDIADTLDNCPAVRNGACNTDEASLKSDTDRRRCDIDADGSLSNAELQASSQFDWNKDGIGDACDDTDGDDIMDYIDNCKFVPNESQVDIDQDGKGNECDDDDGDAILDTADNCVLIYNPNQLDFDDDELGDACDPCRLDYYNACSEDDDGDGVLDVFDCCPTVPNAEQRDTDNDGIGDVCDNCPTVANPDQEDSNNDGTGNVCEITENKTAPNDDIPIFKQGGSGGGCALGGNSSLGMAMIGLLALLGLKKIWVN